MDIYRDLAGHELLDVRQEGAAYAGDYSKRNGRVPDILQRFRICHLAGVLGGRQHRVRHASDHCCCAWNLRSVCYYEVRGQSFVCAVHHSCFANVGGQIGCELREEDVEVDGRSDTAAEEAHTEGESANCSDELIRSGVAEIGQSNGLSNGFAKDLQRKSERRNNERTIAKSGKGCHCDGVHRIVGR